MKLTVQRIYEQVQIIEVSSDATKNEIEQMMLRLKWDGEDYLYCYTTATDENGVERGEL